MRLLGDPTTCPSCGVPAAPTERCARCAVRLHGEDATHVLTLLTQADRVIGRMRDEATRWRTATAAPWPPAPAAGPHGPRPGPAPAPAPVTRPTLPGPLPRTHAAPLPGPMAPSPATGRRSWSVGGVLLALGALCLVVAAAVFVTVSWERMGLGGRTAVLAGLTAVAAAASTVVTRRRLRASAEALWAVTAGFVTLDYWAGRATGLLGADRLDVGVSTVVFGVLLTGLGAVAVTLARRAGVRHLVVGEVAVGVGVAAAMWGLVLQGEGAVPWCLAATLVGTLGTAGAVRARLVVASAVVGGLTVLALVAATLLQVGDLMVWAEAGPRGLAAPATVLGFLAVLAAAASTAVLLQRRGHRAHVTVVVPTTVAVAVLHVALPALTWAGAAPGVDDHALAVSLVLAGLAVVLAVGAAPDLGLAARGLRIGAAAAAACVAALIVGWIAIALAGVADSVVPVWSGTWTTRIAVGDELGAWWGAVALALALATTAAIVTRWRGVPLPAGSVRVAALGTLAGCAAVLVLVPLLAGAPVVVVVAVLVASATALGVVAALRGDDRALLAAVPPASLAAVVALASQPLSITTWTVVAVLGAVGTLVARTPAAMAASASIGSVLGLATVPAVCDLLGAPSRGTWLAVAVSAVLVGLLAQSAAALVPSASVPARRLPVEAAAALTGAVVLATALTDGLAWAAVMWTVVGAGVALVGLVARDRRPAVPVGSGILVVAYVLRLAAGDVRVVEAYTLPLALAVLGAGAYLLHRDARVRTWLALGPGLTLALLPSLPLALLDPTSLRGLVLTGASVVVVGVGAALRWQAPFLAGVALAAVMAVRHLGPYADALPRWAMLAVAGVVLLGAGITWEQRVRQARSAAVALAALR